MPDKNANVATYEKWYSDNKDLYSACAITVQKLIDTLLSQEGVPFHSIQYRIKTQDSFLAKCDNPKYTDPVNEITDVCGLRVITYTNKDVSRICEIIEQNFSVDKKNSINKAEQMHTNEVGYLSIHYIVGLSPSRKRLPEYRPYANIKFEIQVRTLLQHAWAEIEHDRSYKFSGELPAELKRRFYLVAGSLELMDREFDRLSEEIDIYAKEVQSKTATGNLDVAIDSTSLQEYLNIKLKDIPVEQRSFSGGDKKLIQELTAFEITTLAQLDLLITPEIIALINSENGVANYVGVLRLIMMVHDPVRYFETAWQQHWTGMSRTAYESIKRINPEIENCIKYFHFMVNS